MNTPIALRQRPLLVWLLAYVSPTVYFLLLLLVYRLNLPTPPAILVVSLFCIIPVVALWVCELVVWHSSMVGARKIGWMLFTLLAMALQVGLLLIIIIEAVTVAISYV